MKRRTIFGPLALLGAAIALVALLAWRSPPRVEIHDDDDAASLSSPRVASPASRAPFHSYEVAGSKGAIRVFGSEHTRDPEHPAIAELTEVWESFGPSVALVEGRLGFLLPGLMNPVRTYGESGHAARLARRDGIRLFSWEPTRQAEVRSIIDAIGARRAAVFLVTRPLLGKRRYGEHDDPDAMAQALIEERGSWPGLQGQLSTVADLDREWQEAVPDGPNWRDATDQYGWPPAFEKAVLESGYVRDDHLLRVAVSFARKGERVFVVAGTGHALKLERAFAEAVAGNRQGNRVPLPVPGQR